MPHHQWVDHGRWIECGLCKITTSISALMRDPEAESRNCSSPAARGGFIHVELSNISTGVSECLLCRQQWTMAVTPPANCVLPAAPPVVTPPPPPPPGTGNVRVVLNPAVPARSPVTAAPTVAAPGWLAAAAKAAYSSFGALVTGLDDPVPYTSPKCDMRLSPDGDYYRCSRCPATVPYYDVARAVSQDGYYEWPICGAALKAPRRCTTCGVELCEVLDAYYGRDPVAAGQCAKCRGRSHQTAGLELDLD